MGTILQLTLLWNDVTFDRAAHGKFFKLIIEIKICLISRNMAAPQQIEQVRLPSVCTCFPETWQRFGMSAIRANWGADA